jgi:hypothetical protein
MKCYRCRQTTHCSNTRSWDEANISLWVREAVLWWGWQSFLLKDGLQ